MTKINNYGLAKECFVTTLIAGIIFSIIVSVIALTAGSAQAHLRSSGGLCGRDALCKILEGKEFGLIKYYSMGSVLVILYDSGKFSGLTLFVPEADYRKERGTISDAVDFLEDIPEISGFTVLKGKRSAGWFKTEVIEGVYVIKPQYEVTSEYRAPDYRFSDKGGKIIMYITPTYRQRDDFERLLIH
ncbi:MAG: hypothetical protein HZC48_01630 [Nitrospirae bacterium]|nr:hypothetical protein [Nitrospirota bacterium]